MKQIILAAILAIAGASAMAQGTIEWLGKVHDFGAFSEDRNRVMAEFKFVNRTSEPVAITQVASSCGCTVPAYDTEPIEPGDTATIEVTYNPVGRPGRFEKSVYVRTSADHERYRLVIRGTVIGNPESLRGKYPFEVGPLKLRSGAAMMGRVYKGQAKSEFIDGYNLSGDSIRPTFDQVPAYLTVSATPAVVPPGDMLNINFFFEADRYPDYGIASDSILVGFNPGEPMVSLPVVAIVEEDFSKLTPEQLAKAPQLSLVGDRIDLGAIAAGSTKPVTGKIGLLNRGKEPLVVRSISSVDKAVTAKVTSKTIKPGKTADLVVTYDPTAQTAGVINTRVTIIVNDPSQPTRTVRIVGTVE